MKCEVRINIILRNFREKHNFRNYDKSTSKILKILDSVNKSMKILD